MNKLILILAASLFLNTAGAQDGKPTKEQTFNFLKENFFNKEIKNLDWVDKYGTKRDFYYIFYNYTEYTFEGCILRGKYIRKSEIHISGGSKEIQEKETFTFNIDFSKVESIKSYGSSRASEGGHWEYKLKYTIQHANGKLVEEVLPFGSFTSTNDSIGEEKVYKAFNHLRKLCGAPEPIKFD